MWAYPFLLLCVCVCVCVVYCVCVWCVVCCVWCIVCVWVGCVGFVCCVCCVCVVRVGVVLCALCVGVIPECRCELCVGWVSKCNKLFDQSACGTTQLAKGLIFQHPSNRYNTSQSIYVSHLSLIGWLPKGEDVFFLEWRRGSKRNWRLCFLKGQSSTFIYLMLEAGVLIILYGMEAVCLPPTQHFKCNGYLWKSMKSMDLYAFSVDAFKLNI